MCLHRVLMRWIPHAVATASAMMHGHAERQLRWRFSYFPPSPTSHADQDAVVCTGRWHTLDISMRLLRRSNYAPQTYSCIRAAYHTDRCTAACPEKLGYAVRGNCDLIEWWSGDHGAFTCHSLSCPDVQCKELRAAATSASIANCER